MVMAVADGEVIARSFVELLPRAMNFGRDASAQIRQQMGAVAAQFQRTNQQVAAATVKNAKQASAQVARQVKDSADQTVRQAGRARDGSARAAKQAADDQVRHSKRATDQTIRDSSRASARISKNFGGVSASVGRSFKGLGGVVAGALAGVAIGGFIKSTITAASDLNETISKTGVIFGQQALPGLQKFSQTAATALGQSQQSALDAVATFGIFGKSAGLQGPKLAGFSEKLTTLAGDMASFSNTTPEEAIDAIGAALRGEAEPIRKYGVLIDDASTRQEALRLGIIKSVKTALTPQQRVLAVNSLIFKQTATAQGDFARTSGGLANQQRILSAQFANFKSSVGQIALPLVVKLFTFLNTKGLPALKTVQYGIEGMVSAFKGEGVTSSGFVGFMERIGVVARTVFGFFKAEVLPRLKEFAAVIITQVVPFIVQLVRNVGNSLRPALEATFGFIAKEVIPRLREWGQWLGQNVVPKLAELATSLSKNKDFLVPFVAVLLSAVVVFKAITLAIKAWAAIQFVLNAVLNANPIGLVVLAIAALVAGAIWAYKNVGWFHDAVLAAFHGIQKAAQIFAPLVKAAIDIVVGVFKLWWNYFAKPILTAFWTYLKFAWERAKDFAKIVATAFAAIKEPARAAIAFVVNQFLGFIETILDGAAKAFGWVPELGPKLKSAAKHFGEFRDNVNAALAKVKDQTVNVTPRLKDVTYKVGRTTYTTPLNVIGSAGRGMATGGPIKGPGTTTSDSIPIRASKDEHLWSAKEVAGAGGHGVMAQMRAYARSGKMTGHASGGRPGLRVATPIPSSRTTSLWASEVATDAVKGAAGAVGRAAAAAYAKMSQFGSGGPSGPPGRRQSFRGVTLNTRTIQMVLAAERLLRSVFHITQGSYSTRVAASGSTHAGGGAMDTNDAGRGWNTAVRALRNVGFASWHRTPAMGPWGHHIHSIARGDPSASPAAKRQVADFIRGGDGLGHLSGGVSPGSPEIGSNGKTRNTPSFRIGAWKIFSDRLAAVHRGEMVVPTNEAEQLRALFTTTRSGTPSYGGTSSGRADGYLRLHPEDIDRLADAVAERPTMLNGTRLDYAVSNEAARRYR